MMDEILEKLIEMGKITEDDLRDVQMSIITPAIRDATNLIHTLFCIKHHAQAEDLAMYPEHTDICTFYAEDAFANCWSMAGHKEWLARLREIMEDYLIKTPEELISCMQKASGLMERVYSLDKPTRRFFFDYLNAVGIPAGD